MTENVSMKGLLDITITNLSNNEKITKQGVYVEIADKYMNWYDSETSTSDSKGIVKSYDLNTVDMTLPSSLRSLGINTSFAFRTSNIDDSITNTAQLVEFACSSNGIKLQWMKSIDAAKNLQDKSDVESDSSSNIPTRAKMLKRASTLTNYAAVKAAFGSLSPFRGSIIGGVTSNSKNLTPNNFQNQISRNNSMRGLLNDSIEEGTEEKEQENDSNLPISPILFQTDEVRRRSIRRSTRLSFKPDVVIFEDKSHESVTNNPKPQEESQSTPVTKSQSQSVIEVKIMPKLKVLNRKILGTTLDRDEIRNKTKEVNNSNSKRALTPNFNEKKRDWVPGNYGNNHIVSSKISPPRVDRRINERANIVYGNLPPPPRNIVQRTDHNPLWDGVDSEDKDKNDSSSDDQDHFQSNQNHSNFYEANNSDTLYNNFIQPKETTTSRRRSLHVADKYDIHHKEHDRSRDKQIKVTRSAKQSISPSRITPSLPARKASTPTQSNYYNNYPNSNKKPNVNDYSDSKIRENSSPTSRSYSPRRSRSSVSPNTMRQTAKFSSVLSRPVSPYTSLRTSNKSDLVLETNHNKKTSPNFLDVYAYKRKNNSRSISPAGGFGIRSSSLERDNDIDRSNYYSPYTPGSVNIDEIVKEELANFQANISRRLNNNYNSTTLDSNTKRSVHDAIANATKSLINSNNITYNLDNLSNSNSNSNSHTTETAERLRLSKWLKNIGLNKYESSLKSYGITKLSILELLSNKDIEYIMKSNKSIESNDNRVTKDIIALQRNIKELSETTKKFSEQILIDNNISTANYITKSIRSKTNKVTSHDELISNLSSPDSYNSDLPNNHHEPSYIDDEINNSSPPFNLSIELNNSYSNHEEVNKATNKLNKETIIKNFNYHLNRNEYIEFFQLWNKINISSDNLIKLISPNTNKQIYSKLYASLSIEYQIYLYFTIKLTTYQINSQIYNNFIQLFKKFLNSLINYENDYHIQLPILKSQEFAKFSSIVFISNPKSNSLYDSLYQDSWLNNVIKNFNKFLSIMLDGENEHKIDGEKQNKDSQKISKVDSSNIKQSKSIELLNNIYAKNSTLSSSSELNNSQNNNSTSKSSRKLRKREDRQNSDSVISQNIKFSTPFKDSSNKSLNNLENDKVSNSGDQISLTTITNIQDNVDILLADNTREAQIKSIITEPDIQIGKNILNSNVDEQLSNNKLDTPADKFKSEIIVDEQVIDIISDKVAGDNEQSSHVNNVLDDLSVTGSNNSQLKKDKRINSTEVLRNSISLMGPYHSNKLNKPTVTPRRSLQDQVNQYKKLVNGSNHNLNDLINTANQ